MKGNLKKTGWYMAGGLLILLFIFAMFRRWKKIDALDPARSEIRYTVANITGDGYAISQSSSHEVLFSFEVAGRTIQGSTAYQLENKHTTRYLLKYAANNPGFHELMQQIPVPDSIVPPPEGWASPPAFATPLLYPQPD